jgi:hypothetical protein
MRQCSAMRKRSRTKSSPNQNQIQPAGKKERKEKKVSQTSLDGFIKVGGARSGEDTFDEHSGDCLEHFPDFTEKEKVALDKLLGDLQEDPAVQEKSTPVTMPAPVPVQSSPVGESSPQSSGISPPITPQRSPQGSPNQTPSQVATSQVTAQTPRNDKVYADERVLQQLESHGQLLQQILRSQQQVSSDMVKLQSHMNTLTSRLDSQFNHIQELEQRVNSLEQKEQIENTGRLDRLEDQMNYMERKQREKNIRLIGIAESRSENCYNIVTDIISNELGVPVNVDVAHRTGRKDDQYPRHIIFRVSSMQEKMDVLRAQKQALKHKAYFFVEDLSKKDYNTKRALKPVIIKAREEGKRWRFRDGKLFVNGELITPGVRDQFTSDFTSDYDIDHQSSHQSSQPIDHHSEKPVEKPVDQSVEQPMQISIQEVQQPAQQHVVREEQNAAQQQTQHKQPTSEQVKVRPQQPSYQFPGYGQQRQQQSPHSQRPPRPPRFSREAYHHPQSYSGAVQGAGAGAGAGAPTVRPGPPRYREQQPRAWNQQHYQARTPSSDFRGQSAPW